MQVSILLSVLLLLFANIIGVVGFCRCWYNVLFCMSTKLIKLNVIDLTSKELLISSFFILSLLTLPLIPNFFF
jgi:hypothetical protein